MHAVEAVAGPTTACPDIAVDIRSHGVRSDDLAVNLDLGELPWSCQGLLVDYVEDLDVALAAASIDDVEQIVVW